MEKGFLFVWFILNNRPSSTRKDSIVFLQCWRHDRDKSGHNAIFHTQIVQWMHSNMQKQTKWKVCFIPIVASMHLTKNGLNGLSQWIMLQSDTNPN